MARRRRGRKGGRKSKSIAILPTLPPLFAAKASYDAAGGFNTNMANRLVETMTGYNMVGKTFSVSKATPFWLGMIAAIGTHKVANKLGVNKYIRKATMGYLVL